MAVMEIASLAEPCEELFHIHRSLWKLRREGRGSCAARSAWCICRPALKRINGGRRESCLDTDWGDSWGSKRDRRWLGGLTATESMACAFISSLSSSSALSLIPVDQTQLGDICWLMDLFALSEDVGSCPTAMDYPWWCDWSYQWTQLSPGCL